MKPTLALDLRHDSITLLHRAGDGWRAIGSTAFGAPDMDAALADMRAAAKELSPQGLATKLIIPNDQILYTLVSAPGPGRAARRTQVREALAGRTPYAVDDLAFDWAEPVPEGATEVLVAAIARETLADAEAFLASHGLNPSDLPPFPTIPPLAASHGSEPRQLPPACCLPAPRSRRTVNRFGWWPRNRQTPCPKNRLRLKWTANPNLISRY